MTESEATENKTPTRERIRWVRYAADCAERVLHLAGPHQPKAEAVIQAARAWADDPTGERLDALRGAGADASRESFHLLSDSETHYIRYDVRNIRSNALRAACHVADTAILGNPIYYAVSAAWEAEKAATLARTLPAPTPEQAWQEERLKFYGFEP